MMRRKNKRTLKKRIKRVISLSTFLTVLFISGVIIFLILFLSRGFAAYQSEVISRSIQQDIYSGNAAKPLGVSRIEDLSKDDTRIRMWLKDLNPMGRVSEFLPFISDINTICIKIEIKGKVLFSNEEGDMKGIEEFYRDTQSERMIYDSKNNVIGKITVRVNPQFLLVIVIPLLVFIILLSLLALIISHIMSLFLVFPIIAPIKKLETKMKAIAEGDHQTASNTEIVLKRPLKEIESLADSTNSIMKKLKGYNIMLESQKETLKNQNAELEAQNEELMESKLAVQKQQAHLVQSEKMASIGFLTAAITHEINTPIGAINSNVQIEEMLLNTLIGNPAIDSNEELGTMLGQLKEANDVNLMALNRITEIIKSLKTFSRLDQAEFQEANINDGIKSVLVLVNNLLKRRITVHEEFGDIPLVKCFPSQLNQVFMNIIVNASQAIEGAGDIYIKTYQEGRHICISIKDTGMGIKEENISRIFDPGFTSKGIGIGLGLGLYISYNIVQNHKGQITVTSEYGKGAEFTIKIPMDNVRT